MKQAADPGHRGQRANRSDHDPWYDLDVQRSMQAGLNAHLSKQVQIDTLFETLESLIK
ncbi:MAG: hypothetical protein IJQ43_08990 [Oscillospiraceae bacterium]|nr:hypothetical protein [Oscillospiraceae bacterium]